MLDCLKQKMSLMTMALGIAFVLLFAGCAAPPKEDTPELYWPFPPENPRIKFIDLILGSHDVTGSRADKFKNIVFGSEGEIMFEKPTYIALYKDMVLISDITRVHVYDFGRKQYRALGRGRLTSATGVAVTSEGWVFVGDSHRKRVLLFIPGADDPRVFGERGSFSRPGGIAVDEKNRHVLITDSIKHEVLVYSYEGTKLFTIGGRGREDGQLNFPYDVAVDKDGRVYVLDSGNFRVQIFDSNGKFIRMFGSVGTEGGMFARPKSLALDSDGHIYVVDAAFGNFQIFDEFGNLFLAVGTNGVDPGMFMLPFGIAIDKNDKIYVADQINKRIQIFQYLKDSSMAPPQPQQ